MRAIVLVHGNRDRAIERFDTVAVDVWGGRGNAIRIEDPDQITETKDGGVRITVDGESEKLMSAELVEVVHA